MAAAHIRGTKASGATRWINERPIIQLSSYGRHADKMWFTLFREIGHARHGKREQFISFESGVKSTEEKEADDFAAKRLYLIRNMIYFFQARFIKGVYSKICKTTGNPCRHSCRAIKE